MLVCGASRGIGFATCQRLADRGFSVVGIARDALAAFPGAFFPVDLAAVSLRAPDVRMPHERIVMIGPLVCDARARHQLRPRSAHEPVIGLSDDTIICLMKFQLPVRTP